MVSAAQAINFINKTGQQEVVKIALLDAISALAKAIVPAVAQDGNLRGLGAPYVVYQAAKLVLIRTLVLHVLTLRNLL